MLKLISIHIPKTAGRSFYQVLKWAYGERLDIQRNRDQCVVNGKFDESLLDLEKTEVLHGHFSFKHIEHLHKEYDPKVVVWFREPIDRVISNYFYTIRMNQLKPLKTNSSRRLQLSLLEFASRPMRRNLMTRRISGLKLEDIYFTGLTERFKEHLALLGKMLGWPEPVPLYYENRGTDNYQNQEIATIKEDITLAMKEKIAELNTDDIKLYKAVVKRMNELTIDNIP